MYDIFGDLNSSALTNQKISFFFFFFCLQLSEKVYLDKKRPIKPIQLPTQQINLRENKTCTVAGWGATKSGGETVDSMQVVDVPIINLEKCKRIWQNSIPDNVICAGGYYKNKGICQVFLY